MKTTKIYAVAQHNETGKFFRFVHGAGACSIGHVDHPSKAAEGQYTPYNDEDLLGPLREPAYYLENSSRMRGWLENHTMVWITETTESKIT
jgi:hypothetical protein